jgi:uncharacterized YccA/Bax inhibitor family protein
MEHNMRLTPLHKTGLVLAIVGLVVSASFLIASYILGVDTATGDSLSRTGATLTIVFAALAVVLSAPVLRHQRKSRRQ